MKVTFLNIPNVACSFYVKAILECRELSHKKCLTKFPEFNFATRIIFSLETKGAERIIVIDNSDHLHIDQKLLGLADYYFVTNYRKEMAEYQNAKVFPLYPHFPINYFNNYLWFFKSGFLGCISRGQLRAAAGTLNYLRELPYHTVYDSPASSIDNYIFFSSSIWKKEELTNKLRKKFMIAVKSMDEINFEGGFAPRKDGFTDSCDMHIMGKRISPRNFKKKIASSLINFNCPAVKGAVSWRVGELLNLGKCILSTPFHTTFPVSLEHGKNIWYVEEGSEWRNDIRYLLSNENVVRKIEAGALEYYNQYCTPGKQFRYILNCMGL